MAVFRRVALLLAAFWLLVLLGPSAAAQTFSCTLCVSQLYLGADGAGFVELFNATAEPLTLNGWQLAYGRSSADQPQILPLAGTTVAPFSYLLVGFTPSATVSPPPADLSALWLVSPQAGRLALLDGPYVIDVLTYGSARGEEGPPAAELLPDQALHRRNAGCTDTNDNAADFAQAPPAPRSSLAAPNPCTSDQPPTAIPTATPPPTPTPDIPTPTDLPTPTPTLPEPTATPTSIPTPIPTPIPTLSPSAPTATPALLDDPPTLTPLPTATDLPPATPMSALTFTMTPTPLEPPTPSPTPAATAAPGLVTPAATPTQRPSATATAPVPSPQDTPTAPATTPAPSTTVLPTLVPLTATVAPTALPARWLPGPTPSPLHIEEIAYAGSGEEYIVLLNASREPLALAGWLLGDAQQPRANEGLYALPADRTLAPGGLFIVARRATSFYSRFGAWPDAAFEDDDATWILPTPIPLLARRTDLAGGRLALDDGGDEVVLLAPDASLADAVAFGGGDYAALGLVGTVRAPGSASLQLVPGASFPAVPDMRQRFCAALPQPFAVLALPAGGAPLGEPLGGGLLALWGTLGATSSFSGDGGLPPHAALAVAAQQELSFVAFADLDVVAEPLNVPANLAVLPAWGWQRGGEGSAVVYGAPVWPGLTRVALAANLGESSAPVQWLAGDDPTLPGLVALAGADVRPERIDKLFARWQALGRPLLPAGNAALLLPGSAVDQPLYTGLAVTTQDTGGVLAALAAQRGWLTSTPGLWLTLRAVNSPTGDVWMGDWLPPANTVTLEIVYGDRSGQPASLALWLDGEPIQQRDAPGAIGAWRVVVPAAPGSSFAAVAIQADGDFAVTAPLFVAAAAANTVLINEVLPAPHNDANGDGTVDTQDEYIELYNPGETPVSLAGWQIGTGDPAQPLRRHTLRAGLVVPGGGRLVLWRAETRLPLNNLAGNVFLLAADSSVQDRAGWDEGLDAGRTVARLPDGAGWLQGMDVTPGSPNTNTGRGAGWGRAPNTGFVGDHPPASNPYGDLPPVPTLEPTYGQAGGAPGSVAQSKLAGLNATVDLRAVVVVPPGRFPSSIYVADPAGAVLDGWLAAIHAGSPGMDSTTNRAGIGVAGIGVNVYLQGGEFPALQEGDVVLLTGRWRSYRGELELVLDSPDQIWKLDSGGPLAPLPVSAPDIGESLEGRLISFSGIVTGWEGESLFLADSDHPFDEPVRVTVRASLDWRRPKVTLGELWHVTGVVSQSAARSPWNGGYRVLVRCPEDLVLLRAAP